MRKVVLMEQKKDVNEQSWPTKEVKEITESLYEYLKEYVPGGPPSYSKHAIMGPVGKLLSMLSSGSFGDNTESYIGYILNIHNQSLGRPISRQGQDNLRKGAEELLKLKATQTPRIFKRILESVDYGVFYLKTREIAERSAMKRAALTVVEDSERINPTLGAKEHQ